MVRNLGWMAAEFARLPRYTRENIEEAMILDGFENFAAAKRRGKGVLFLTGHMGAWELKPFAHALYSEPIYFLGAPDRQSPRRRPGEPVSWRYPGTGRSTRTNPRATCFEFFAMEASSEFLADQNTVPAESVFVDFFGIPAATTSGIARLARRTGAPWFLSIATGIPRIRKYRLRYEPALDLTPTDDEQNDIRNYSARFNQVIEDYVRRFPDQWLWVHRRWKTRPPTGIGHIPGRAASLCRTDAGQLSRFREGDSVMMANRTAGDLAKFLGCALQGEADLNLKGVASPEAAEARRSRLP